MTSIAIDTNLLLLLIVGNVRRDLVGAHRRLKSYRPSDYDLLCRLLDGAKKIIATPNTVTEVSNLLPYGVNEPLLADLMAEFRAYIRQIQEVYCKSALVVEEPEYAYLRLTDTAWLVAIDKDTSLLTADALLHEAALARGLSSTNFNHQRNLDVL
jgi:hypothetical protein